MARVGHLLQFPVLLRNVVEQHDGAHDTLRDVHTFRHVLQEQQLLAVVFNDVGQLLLDVAECAVRDGTEGCHQQQRDGKGQPQAGANAQVE